MKFQGLKIISKKKDGKVTKNQNGFGLQQQQWNARKQAMTSKLFKPTILYPAKLLMKC